MTKFEETIKKRLYRAWDEWKPGYEDWLKWSDKLYAPDAVIVAIGDKPQLFKDYQASMKEHRDACDMDMGIIDTCVVEGDTVAITYQMQMTPKGKSVEDSIVFLVTEFNTFKEIEGFDEPMVVKLQLATGGQAKGVLKHSVLEGK